MRGTKNLNFKSQINFWLWAFNLYKKGLMDFGRRLMNMLSLHHSLWKNERKITFKDTFFSSFHIFLLCMVGIVFMFLFKCDRISILLIFTQKN